VKSAEELNLCLPVLPANEGSTGEQLKSRVDRKIVRKQAQYGLGSSSSHSASTFGFSDNAVVTHAGQRRLTYRCARARK
jgi:hypothetical protein